MRTAILWGIALLVTCSLQAEAFDMRGIGELGSALKSKLDKLKATAMKRLTAEPVKPPTIGAFSANVTKKIMSELKSISSAEIKDPKALEGFVRHLISSHAKFQLKAHHEISMTMLQHVKSVVAKMNIKILTTIDWKKMADQLKKLPMNEMSIYGKEFKMFIKRHRIDLPDVKFKDALKAILKDVSAGKSGVEAMKEVLKKYSKTKMTPAKEAAMLKDLQTTIGRISKMSQENLKAMLKKFGIELPEKGLVEMLNRMIQSLLMMKKKEMPTSVEDSLKEQFNQAMVLMHKAFGEMDPDSKHKLMESMKSRIPIIFHHMMTSLMHHLAKSGRKVSPDEVMKMMAERPEPRKDEDDRICNEDEPKGRRNLKKLLMMILIPIAGILVIALIATGIYYLCRSQRNAQGKSGSLYIEKPPPQYRNPYENMEKPKPVSYA